MNRPQLRIGTDMPERLASEDKQALCADLAGRQSQKPPESLAAPPAVPARSAWRRWLSRVYRRCLVANPAPMLALSGMIGRLTYPLIPNPPWESLGGLLPELPPRRLIEIARELRARTLKNVDLGVLLAHAGLEGILPLVRCRGGEGLRDRHRRGLPAILISWHAGAHYLTIVAGLHRLGVPAHFLGIDTGKRLPPGYEVLPPGNSIMERALSAKKALHYLRRGGVLVIAIDGAEGDSPVHVPCLGRWICLRRGPALLARLSGAPLIPIIQNWDPGSGTVTLQIHRPLPWPEFAGDKEAFDTALLTRAAAWFEGYIRCCPEGLSGGKLGVLLGAPRIGDSAPCFPVR